MKVLVAGGSGFIGRALCRELVRQNHEVTVLSRSHALNIQEKIRYVAWDLIRPESWIPRAGPVDALVNLAGASIADGRWTQARKRELVESRSNSTRSLVENLSKMPIKPKILINASAVGYYGPRDDEAVDEETVPGHDFLAQLCVAWEREALAAERSGLRVVRLRTGIVLGKGGGALAKMLLPFKLGLGGPLGSGQQWMSWIHMDDVVGIITWALDQSRVKGALNLTAPHPVTNEEFSKTLGAAVHRPAVLRAPVFALRLALGEMAEMLLTGQRALPKKLLSLGYQFRYPKLDKALNSIVG